jgi:hypothetical protein
VLLDVACAGPRCVVVGFQGAQALAFTWSGGVLQREPTPPVTGGVLSAIALARALGVAVGYTSGAGSNPSNALIELRR